MVFRGDKEMLLQIVLHHHLSLNISIRFYSHTCITANRISLTFESQPLADSTKKGEDQMILTSTNFWLTLRATSLKSIDHRVQALVILTS